MGVWRYNPCERGVIEYRRYKMMTSNGVGVKEVIPRTGLLFQSHSLNPVLCKPKLLPLKSVTLEKLERMQKDGQQKMLQQNGNEINTANKGQLLPVISFEGGHHYFVSRRTQWN